MIKIVKNVGQCKARALQNCKYLFYTNDFSVGEMYAKVRPSTLFYYVIAKIKRAARP